MATPFLQNFYQVQQLALELQTESNNLEKLGTNYLQQMKPQDLQNDGNNDDPELGQSNPLLKKIDSISQLIQRLRALSYNCESFVTNQIERTKLSQIEKQCVDGEQLLHRFRNRLSERRRQLEMDLYLFGNKRPAHLHNNSHNNNNGDNDEQSSLLGKSRTDYYNQEQDSLQNALKTMHNTLNNAYESVNSLERQKQLFFNIQRKTADIAGQLGFSKQVVGWIQRQENTNTIITFVGMFITIFIVGVFYYWWNHGGKGSSWTKQTASLLNE